MVQVYTDFEGYIERALKVRVQKLSEHAIVPKYSKEGDAGLDLTAIGKRVTEEFIEYSTGLAIEIPAGYVGLIFPRSSITTTGQMLKNSVGVIDSGYRGEIKVRMQEVDGNPITEYRVGDRVAQLIIMPYPQIELIESETLSTSVRGAGGWGSSGK